MTPTARTLAYLRQAGFLADVVERWVPIPGKNIRRDLFRVADVLAIHPRRREFLLVQATSAGHVGDRLARVRARPELRTWLQAGGLFECWGWAKRGERWHCKRAAVRAADLAAVLMTPIARRQKQRQRELFDTEADLPCRNAAERE